jgi:hypothetical protein
MISQDSRPTKAQFAAMSPQQRSLHTRPLAPDGQPYPRMTGAELKQLRTSLGFTPRDFAAKLKLRVAATSRAKRAAIGGAQIERWEEGNTKKYGQKAIVPGRIAYNALSLTAKATAEE